jgi:phage terminase large subunit-like protein
MTKPVKPPDLLELKNVLASSLRRTSTNPTIFGYHPQKHQETFHRSGKVGRLFLGGNRAGKTVAGAAETVMWMTGNHPFYTKFKTPVRCRAVGVDFDNGVNRIMKPEIARWMPPSYLINGSWEDSYERSSRTLTLTNGSTLEFMSYDQDVDKFAGTSRHFVWFDEEPPEDIFNECLLRLADVGGHWIMTMTPLIDMSWTLDRLYEKGYDGTNPNLDVFRASTLENQYISSSILDIITEGLSDEEKQARREGLYYSYTGAIYADVFKDAVIPPVVDTDRWGSIYSNWGHFAMLDHGFTNPTAFYLGAFDKEGRIIIYKEYYESKRIVKENAEAIKEIISDLRLQNKIDYIVADPSTRNTDPITGTSIQQEYAEHGLYFAMANNDVSAGINRVYSRFKNQQLYITNDCEMAVWEHQRYRWAKFANSRTESKNNLKETPLKKNDHACDAIRYGVVSRPALPGESDLKRGIMLPGTSVAISEGHPMMDYDLIPGYQQEKLVYDSVLGDDW